jgi:hypothetical protein
VPVGVRIAAIERTLLDALDQGTEPAAAWRAYRKAHADVLDYYESAFGGPQGADDQRLGEAVAAQAPLLRRRECALALGALAPRVAALMELSDDEALDAVTFIGWGRAIAWCDDESDQPRAYFALERLPDRVGQIRVIAAHELGHLGHIAVRPGDWAAWSVGGGIVMEAVAVATARAFARGVDPTDQLNVQPGALAAYARRREAIHAAVLALVDVVDEATYRRVMFPPWLCEGDVAGVNESGYAIAWALADAWDARGISVAQTARRPRDQARGDLVELLSA